MPSEFVQHFTRPLTLIRTGTNWPGHSPAISQHEEGESNAVIHSRTKTLHGLLIKTQGPLKLKDIDDCVRLLHALYQSHHGAFVASEANHEKNALEEAIVGQLTVALYANALDKYLAQATQVEAEAEWWADLENSTFSVAFYLLQTLPLRVSRVVNTTLDTLRARQLPISFSTWASSFLSLFASPSLIFRPSLIMTTFFPHLRDQESLALAIFLPPNDILLQSSTTVGPISAGYKHILHAFSFISRFVNLPIELTRQECRHNRKALEKMRDERARVIGEFAQLRIRLDEFTSFSNSGPFLSKYTSFLNTLQRVMDVEHPSSTPFASPLPLDSLDDVCRTLSSVDSIHAKVLRERHLLRPSRLTSLWPNLLILPPLSLYIYANHTSWVSALAQMANDAKETVRGFVQGWLVEPLMGVLRTVKAGSGSDFLVHEEGVAADLESLERMTLSLAQDRLQFTPQQLETLAEKVRLGDLTPVMQIYEQDIRTPFRSALTGTLLRSLFIQLQKAKVDIDQALSGIDKLLKSQELTFALVGVAPAFAIVYVAGGAIVRLWNGSIVKGRWGGRKRRRGVWEGLRRIERLLTKQPFGSPTVKSTGLSTSVSTPLAPLTTGLLILSLTRLRSYALHYLPANIREPFLEDLGDLEDTRLGTEAKLRIVDRMWRCWGSAGEGVIHF